MYVPISSGPTQEFLTHQRSCMMNSLRLPSHFPLLRLVPMPRLLQEKRQYRLRPRRKRVLALNTLRIQPFQRLPALFPPFYERFSQPSRPLSRNASLWHLHIPLNGLQSYCSVQNATIGPSLRISAPSTVWYRFRVLPRCSRYLALLLPQLAITLY